MRRKNLCVHGEDAKRLLAYSPNMPKDIKACIYSLIIIQILKNFGFFLSTLYGIDCQKTISRYCPFKYTPLQHSVEGGGWGGGVNGRADQYFDSLYVCSVQI
jgi:hypothetical protein